MSESEWTDDVELLKKALNEALAITDSCCQCVYFDADDGYLTMRDSEPCEHLNAARLR